jgi:hypothetical protein
VAAEHDRRARDTTAMKWRPAIRTVGLVLLTAVAARISPERPPASATASADTTTYELAAAEIAAPTSVPTLPLITATPLPTPSNLLPAPTSLSAAISPRRDAVTLSWAPSSTATVIAYRVLLYESATQQRPLRDVAGSQLQATLTGLDPRVGYAFVVAAVDQWGRQGLLSAPLNTAASPTMTLAPTLTLPPTIILLPPPTLPPTATPPQTPTLPPPVTPPQAPTPSPTVMPLPTPTLPPTITPTPAPTPLPTRTPPPLPTWPISTPTTR